jgi:hypothetical protein
LAAPARAATLSVDQATVVFSDASPGAGGRIQLQGRFMGFTFDPRERLRLSVGASTRWATLRKAAGETWVVRSGEHGYELSLDLRLRRFSATEVDVLPGRENPVTIELRQGPRVACTMIEFTEEGQRWSFAAGRNRQFPCVLETPPAADPPSIPVGEATPVRFRLRMPSGRRPERGTLRLVRVDETGAGGGTPLCDLRDRGVADEGDERAGDGVYACRVTLTEPAPGAVRVRAEGRLGATPVASPSARVDVVPATATPAAEAGPGR